MNKTITIFLFLLCYLNTYGQKTIEISDDKRDQFFYKEMPGRIKTFGLEDLRNSTDSLRIRIWNTYSTVEIKQQNGVKACLTQWVRWSDPIIKKVEFESEISKQLLDSLLAYDITTIPDDNKWGIDGSYVTIEISTPKKYRAYTYWSPSCFQSEDRTKVVKINNLCFKILNTKQHLQELIETLSPGGYGLSSRPIDRFLPIGSIESSLYQEVKKRMQLKLGIDEHTSHTKFPYFIIDMKPSYMKGLNDYELSDVKKIKILTMKDKESLIYGMMAKKGIVVIETKE